MFVTHPEHWGAAGAGMGARGGGMGKEGMGAWGRKVHV